jgi:hypothetical protein
MSWAIEFVAKSKAKAAAEIDAIVARDTQGLPATIASIMKNRIDTLPDPVDDRAIYVQSNGHIDANVGGYGYANGDAKFRVSLIPFLLALLLVVFAAPAFAEDSTPKFGGCEGTTCYGPTVSVNVISIDLNDGDVTTQFSPGIGYGVTFDADKWHRWGFSANFALKGTADGQKAQPSILFSFAEFVRLGLTSVVGAGNFLDNAAVLVSFGTDIGSPIVAEPEPSP